MLYIKIDILLYVLIIRRLEIIIIIINTAVVSYLKKFTYCRQTMKIFFSINVNINEYLLLLILLLNYVTGTVAKSSNFSIIKMIQSQYSTLHQIAEIA